MAVRVGIISDIDPCSYQFISQILVPSEPKNGSGVGQKIGLIRCLKDVPIFRDSVPKVWGSWVVGGDEEEFLFFILGLGVGCLFRSRFLSSLHALIRDSSISFIGYPLRKKC